MTRGWPESTRSKSARTGAKTTWESVRLLKVALILSGWWRGTQMPRILNHYYKSVREEVQRFSATLSWKTEQSWPVCRVSQPTIEIHPCRKINRALWICWDSRASSANLQIANTQIQGSPRQWWTHLKWLNYHMWTDRMDLRSRTHSRTTSNFKAGYHQSLNKHTTAPEPSNKCIQVKLAVSAWKTDISTIQTQWEGKWTHRQKWT